MLLKRVNNLCAQDKKKKKKMSLPGFRSYCLLMIFKNEIRKLHDFDASCVRVEVFD